MCREIYRYRFEPFVPSGDVKTALAIATLDAESLHGQAGVRLDTALSIDDDERVWVIDASTPVGRDVNRLFVGGLIRSLGEDCFHVERIDSMPRCEQEAGK